MVAETQAIKRVVTSGEGERRAMRGYVPQWKLAARLIYAGLASGSLRWVGLADPSAGSFDDVVLGYRDQVVGYQLKTSRNGSEFRLKTLLLGAEALWSKIIGSWKELKAANPGVRIKLCFGTDAQPSTADNLGTEARPVSTAAFLRAMEANGATWSLLQWEESPYAPFLNELRLASGVDDRELQELWRNLSFLTGGSARAEGLAPILTLSVKKLYSGFCRGWSRKPKRPRSGGQRTNSIRRCGGEMPSTSGTTMSSLSTSWYRATLRQKMLCEQPSIRLKADTSPLSAPRAAVNPHCFKPGCCPRRALRSFVILRSSPMKDMVLAGLKPRIS